jgi:hypothetical protein
MLSLHRIAILLLLTPISQAIPHHNRTNTLGEVLRELSPKPNQLAINKRDITDYRTMPPGTYTETISTSLIRIIIVNDPTPTLCAAECDCSGIKDKKSPEYEPHCLDRYTSWGGLLTTCLQILSVFDEFEV